MEVPLPPETACIQNCAPHHSASRTLKAWLQHSLTTGGLYRERRQSPSPPKQRNAEAEGNKRIWGYRAKRETKGAKPPGAKVLRSLDSSGN